MTLMNRLSLVLAALLLTVSSSALAGEDFPFFCSFQDSSYSFKVTPDSDSPSGYAMTIYRRFHIDRHVDAAIKPTEDGKYWLVSGQHRTMGGLVERSVLAYIGFFEGRTSHGDILTRSALAEGKDWNLRPLSCRRL
jgi:hypothetical protein